MRKRFLPIILRSPETEGAGGDGYFHSVEEAAAAWGADDGAAAGDAAGDGDDDATGDDSAADDGALEDDGDDLDFEGAGDGDDDAGGEDLTGDDDGNEDEPAAEKLPAIELPPSWPKDQADHFAKLPRATQEFIRAREADREKFVSTKANEYAQAQQRAAAMMQHYDAGLAQVQGLLQQNDPLAAMTPQQWAQLAADDPAQWAVLKQQSEMRQQQAAAVAEERAHLARMREAETAQRLQQRLLAEKEKLAAAEPLFADPAKAKAEVGRIKSFLTDIGFTEAELNSLVDHRTLRVARLAMLYTAAQKARAEKQQGKKPAPHTQRPSGKPNKGGKARQARDAAFRQYEKTGDLRALANLID